MQLQNPVSKKAAIICRVSTDQQQTLRQVDLLLEYAQRMGYHVTQDHLFEDKVSGYSKRETRPQLSRFYKCVENGEVFDAVFVERVDRIARKPIEGQNIVHKIAEELNLPVYVYKPEMCSVDDKGNRNMLFYGMLGWLLEWANHDAETFKSKSASGMLTKIKQGFYHGGPINYGYKRVDKRMVIDEEEAVIVRRIYNYVLQGLGGKRIAGILNDEKIPTRYNKSYPDKEISYREDRPSKSTKDIVWRDKTVQDILGNTLYKGDKNYKGEIYPAPKIIEPEVWEEVQLVMQTRFKSNMKETKYHFILYGLAKCGICGMNYVGRYKAASRESYYNCSSCRHSSCGNRALSISRFDGLIWTMVRRSGWVRNFILANGANQDKLREQITTLESLIKVEENRMKRASTSLERLFDWALEQKDLPINYFDNKKTELSTVIRSAEIQIEKLILEKRSTEKTLESFRNIANIEAMIEQATSDPIRITKILKDILDKIVITSETSSYQANKYLISLFVKGVENPYSFVYVKDINTIVYQPIFETLQQSNNEIERVVINLNNYSNPNIYENLFESIRMLHEGADVVLSNDKELRTNNQEFYILNESAPKVNAWSPQYNEYGILQGNVSEIIARLEKDHGSPIFNPVLIVPDPIPFQALNILKMIPEDIKRD